MYKEFLVNFHKGLRTEGSPRIFEDGECSIAQDCYFDEVGNIFSRRFKRIIKSFDYQVSTIFPYNTMDDLIVILKNGDMYEKTRNILVSSGDLNGSKKLSCVEYDDILYMVNKDNAKRYDGRSRNLQDIGNDIPSSAPTITVNNQIISNCNILWTASADVTAVVDEHDYRTNQNNATDKKSIRLEIADAFTTGLVAYSDIPTIDISGYDSIVLWVKSNINVKSGVLQLLLDDTSGCASALETLDLPALSINEWKLCVLTLSDPSLLTNIISVGLNAASDPGEITVRLDNILAVNTGGLNGTYYYRTTYLDNNNKESKYSAISDSINVGYEKALIDVVESSESKISKINIYRLGGVLTDWYYVTQVSNTTQTVEDDAADSALLILGNAENNDKPPTGLKYIIEHYERLIGANDNTYKNSAQYTVEYQPEYWGNNLNQQYLIGNKSQCTGLLSWGIYVVYTKKDKIYVLEGSNPNAWHRRKSDSSIGNIAPFALEFYKVPIVLDFLGVHLFDGNVEINISEKIKSFFTGIDKSYLFNSIGTVYDKKYYLVIPDQKVLVYDFEIKAFYEYTLKLSEIRYNYLDNLLYAGDDDNNLVTLEDNINNEDMVDSVDFKIKSKAYPLHDVPNKIGNLRNFEVAINTNNEDVSLNIYIDDVLFQTKTINTSSLKKIRDSFYAISKGRYVEFEFTYTGQKQIFIESPLVINPKNA